MKFSHKLSDAVHLLVYIEIFPDDDLSSRAIARSILTNPSMVRSLMMDLRKAGLLNTKQGSAEPELAKKPEEISLYDIFAAVGMDHHLLHVDEDTEQKCPVGGNIQGPLAKAYAEVEEAAFAKMREISLREIVDQIKEEGQLA
ncbi:transcriptional regulator [Lactobacillus delbrueckii subsp. delbrueckii DSM 20074 = JCM 1012]|uniref:Rrf2 family transcriptional regulator n=1 Tax=Lactobacillus delbrueckii TaxID=1584 RepID=UPI0004709543|nr:Rrf2 family transcriptional regulator [Lactobacillus delbrueckii]APP10474.1 transcriptional regulator [Lactobacillus delbrueckii subsp. delbrueckii DSM 20074 = JCM 1012]KNZ38850.1 transcriptional regulator [Lactobacillus delbrueckii subsp. delbrueckii]KRK19483.1 transcriptional regulator [Lactobacillus delbrueckii subsp. delbrueckii DSM 20074 = JCM 1012]MCT3494185.1 Rrf2 family transcriptional regulator [Lactobacillus delbrueckii]MCT3521108.1 Rrf2 family transcriptional regulator [Lactobaci